MIKRSDVPAEAKDATHRHYKGGWYRILINGLVQHTETNEALVIYQHIWPHEQRIYARPSNLFFGALPDGSLRFEPIEPAWWNQ